MFGVGDKVLETPSGWRPLQWLTFAFGLLAGALLLLPERMFGSGGYGGYGQFFLILGALAASAVLGLAGLVVGMVAMSRGTPFSRLGIGLALDVVVLGALVTLVVRM